MNMPSREECEGWNQAQVAQFMFKNKMPDCAATVNRLRINGQRLLNLSESDMSKFSLIHQPQLQKMVQDIKKNDGSLLNKLRRLANKPAPKVPVRDYRADDSWDDLSDPDYDNEMYEDPREQHDENYEPPPSHRSFTSTSSVSIPSGEYLDSCRSLPERPELPPKKPTCLTKASKQLPPEPPPGSDEDDYINPDSGNDEDNYIEPEENATSSSVLHGQSRTGKGCPVLPSHLSTHTASPGVHITPNPKEGSLRHPVNRLCPTPSKHSPPIPLKPGFRLNVKSSQADQKPTEGDEYEVCDPDDGSSSKAAESPPKFFPKPLPRERSPKPPIKPRPAVKPREFESRTLPVTLSAPKPAPKTLTLDLKRQKIPLPLFTLHRADRGSDSTEDDSADLEKDTDMLRKAWYANTCDRRTADEVLLRLNKDGAFMVRKSSGHDALQPYTLVVFYKSRVYNIPIRFIPTTQQYALGREKKGEEYFFSVPHIIENHKKTPLVLIDSQSYSKDATKLLYPVRP